MREVKIVAWCDLCFLEGQSEGDALMPIQVESTQTYVASCAVGEDKRPSLKVLDLCERHGKSFAELAELLASDTIPLVGAKHPSGTPVAVPHVSKPLGRPRGKLTPETASCPVCKLTVRYGSLLVHIWAKHRPGEDKPSVPAICPECRERFEPQGMSIHRKQIHGVDPLVEALKGVPGYVLTGRERDEL